MNSKLKLYSAAAIALLFLAACGSSNPLGDIYGGNNGTTASNAEIRGTVDSVDLNSSSIYLINVSNYNGSMLSNSGNAVRVYFDNRTPVDYQGRSYTPADLERGDQVAVQVDQSGNRLHANSMSVLSDVRNNGGSYPNTPNNTYPNNGAYASVVRGTVRSVDTYRRTISLDTGSGAYSTIQYDANTPLYNNGTTYPPSRLEVGDQIDVRTSANLGTNRYQAQDITVTRSISGNGTYGQTSGSTIRGTVQSVNTSNHTIQLQGVSYTGFDRNTGNVGTIVISYDPNTTIDVQGQAYPISGLERGDVIDVQVSNSGSNNSSYFAQRINLVRDVRQ